MEEARLSGRLERMGRACAGETVTLSALLPELGPRDHALLALLVGVCSLPPVPMPGLSIALALTAVTAGARMALGLPPWIPASLRVKPLPARLPRKLLSTAARLLRKAERLMRPRGWTRAGTWAWRAHGVAIVFCGVMLLIPLPPPTNIPPAAALVLLTLGLLESDGLIVASGYAAVAFSAAFFGAIACLGWTGARALAGV